MHPVVVDTRSLNRRGFTMVELLTVIAIVGMLIGILVPALQSARETARRSQCLNNIRQVGMAVLVCAETKRWLPAACYSADSANVAKFPKAPEGNPGRREHSWRAVIMPYLEEGSTLKNYDMNKHWWDQTSNAGGNAADPSLGVPVDSNAAVAMAHVNVFVCPSAPPVQKVSVPAAPVSDSARPALGAWLKNPGIADLETITGVNQGVVSPERYPSGSSAAKGILEKDRVTRLREVADGMGKTILALECAGRPMVYRGSGNPVPGEVHRGSGWADSLGPFMVSAIREDGLPGASPNAGVPMGVTNDGAPFAFHRGGVNAVFGDSSARYLEPDMEIDVFCALVTKAGGEMVAADE
jgi:prepilin-type N-terminal cleavage/methylation domain-containing protein